MLAAGRVRSKEKKTNEKKKIERTPAAPKAHHEFATTSRRCATKHVPHVSPFSPTSIDPGFLEIGPVKFTKSVKIHECYTYTDRQRDRQTT